MMVMRTHGFRIDFVARLVFQCRFGFVSRQTVCDVLCFAYKSVQPTSKMKGN